MDDSAKAQAKERLESQKTATSSALETLQSWKVNPSQQESQSFVQSQLEYHKAQVIFWEHLLVSLDEQKKTADVPKTDPLGVKKTDLSPKPQSPVVSKTDPSPSKGTPQKLLTPKTAEKPSPASAGKEKGTSSVADTLVGVQEDTLVAAKRPLGQKGRRLPTRDGGANSSSAEKTKSPSVSPAIKSISDKPKEVSPVPKSKAGTVTPSKPAAVASSTESVPAERSKAEPPKPLSTSSTISVSKPATNMFGGGLPGGLGAAMNSELMGKLRKRSDEDTTSGKGATPDKSKVEDKPLDRIKKDEPQKQEAPTLKKPIGFGVPGVPGVGAPMMPVLPKTGTPGTPGAAVETSGKPAWMLNLQKKKAEKEKDKGQDDAIQDELAAAFQKRLKKTGA